MNNRIEKPKKGDLEPPGSAMPWFNVRCTGKLVTALKRIVRREPRKSTEVLGQICKHPRKHNGLSLGMIQVKALISAVPTLQNFWTDPKRTLKDRSDETPRRRVEAFQ